jgi:hypothetical protein
MEVMTLLVIDHTTMCAWVQHATSCIMENFRLFLGSVFTALYILHYVQKTG